MSLCIPGDKVLLMKTTVDIPDELYSQARKLAAARHQQMSALITEGLEKLVTEQPRSQRPKAARKRVGDASLSRDAVRWLSEWRALGERNGAGKAPAAAAAAEIVSRMRR